MIIGNIKGDLDIIRSIWEREKDLFVAGNVLSKDFKNIDTLLFCIEKKIPMVLGWNEISFLRYLKMHRPNNPLIKVISKIPLFREIDVNNKKIVVSGISLDSLYRNKDKKFLWGKNIKSRPRRVKGIINVAGGSAETSSMSTSYYVDLFSSEEGVIPYFCLKELVRKEMVA